MKLFKFLLTVCVLFIATNLSAKSYLVGDIKVVPIEDKYHPISVDVFNASSEDKQKYIPTGKCEGSIMVFIIDDGKSVTLVDAGLGEQNGGKILSELKKAGYTPDMIDNILLTHMHGDHILGAVKKDAKNIEKVFKNATVYVSQLEYYWSKKNKNEKSDSFIKAYDDVIKTVLANDEVIEGVKAIPAVGHTQGHYMYEISSQGDKMLLWGDIVHCLPLQINVPSATVKFDADKNIAASTREEVFEYASKNKLLIGGVHLPYPAVGYIRKKDDKFIFEAK